MTIRSNKDHRYDFKTGKVFGEEAEEELKRAFNDATFELKRDERGRRTGNIYVEFEADPGRTGIWLPSGIRTTEADWWAFKLGYVFVLVPTEHLKHVFAKHQKNVANQPHGSAPTRGVVLKLNSLIADANTPDVPYNSKVKQ